MYVVSKSFLITHIRCILTARCRYVCISLPVPALGSLGHLGPSQSCQMSTFLNDLVCASHDTAQNLKTLSKYQYSVLFLQQSLFRLKLLLKQTNVNEHLAKLWHIKISSFHMCVLRLVMGRADVFFKVHI